MGQSRPMYLLFDDAGKLLTGRILSEADSSLQVELDSGKRSKVKSANALLRFDKPSPSQLMERANALAASMELPLAYEFAPEDEFGFADLAAEYFSAHASAEEKAAALICLHGAPHYFRRAGKGRYKKAPPDILAQALAAIEKKAQVQAQIDAWATQLCEGVCPPSVREQLYRILFKPDKNGPEYKAVVDAAKRSQEGVLALLQRCGAIENAYQFHWQRFLFEHFPKGTGFASLQAPPITEALPVASVQAFSIDDSQTTEIDDALSVQGLGSGTVTVGIHIAAPGLAIAPDSAIDAVARARLSTVYMPGHKITMLPDEVVQTYTLLEGAPRPALSLYVQFNEATLEVVGESQTALEQVPIAHNLRHDQIDHLVSAEWLQGQAPSLDDATLQPLQAPLGFLFRLAQHLKAQREVVRGKPETFNRPDFTFKLDGVGDAGPLGTETVRLGTRRRGAPLDLIVAEAMILANSHWGQWLARCGVPGIYRSQASLAPGVKVRMGAKALPHAGIGVPAYAWSTSPLRRYVDLVNQWQIMACVRNGPTAALVAPFKPKDAQLFGVISAFDTAYTAYNQFQNGMERYWTLQHIRQAGITELDATVIKDGGLVRADTLPLVFPVMGADNVARGSRVRVRLGAMDDISLEVGGTVIGVIGAVGDTAETPDGDEDEDNALAAPVALAIDLNEAPAEAGSGEAA